MIILCIQTDTWKYCLREMEFGVQLQANQITQSKQNAERNSWKKKHVVEHIYWAFPFVVAHNMFEDAFRFVSRKYGIKQVHRIHLTNYCYNLIISNFVDFIETQSIHFFLSRKEYIINTFKVIFSKWKHPKGDYFQA